MIMLLIIVIVIIVIIISNRNGNKRSNNRIDGSNIHSFTYTFITHDHRNNNGRRDINNNEPRLLYLQFVVMIVGCSLL